MGKQPHLSVIVVIVVVVVCQFPFVISEVGSESDLQIIIDSSEQRFRALFCYRMIQLHGLADTDRKDVLTCVESKTLPSQSKGGHTETV